MWLIYFNGFRFDTHGTIGRPAGCDGGEGMGGGFTPSLFIWTVIALQLLFFSAKRVITRNAYTQV